MPILESDLSFEDMRKAEHSFKCAQCGSSLNIAWSAQKDCYMLRCGQSLEHNGVVPYGKDKELLEIANKLRGRPLPMETGALQKLNTEQMLARVNQARFPKDLTTQDRQLMAKISIEYGLDPLFGELMIYQGRPYVTIDARRRKAQETGQLDGISARPATKAERTARQVAEVDYLFVAEVWIKGASHSFEGWGTVRAAETKGSEHLPIVKDPAAMAEKRAEAQALRRAFHIPLPSYEEIIEGEFRDITEEGEATESKSSHLKPGAGPSAPPTKGTITQPQRQKIWGDADKMGYSEDDVHTVIRVRFSVKSINDLSIAQASTLIDMIGKGVGVTGDEVAKSKESNPELWETEGY